jgi:hypothetical protein
MVKFNILPDTKCFEVVGGKHEPKKITNETKVDSKKLEEYSDMSF